MLDDQTPFKLKELFPFIGALVTGGIGGCVACIQHRRTRRETVAAYACAYLITGAFGGLMALAGVAVFLPDWLVGWAELLLISGSAGVVTSIALAAGNLSMRFILKKLGLEITVDVARARKDES